MRNIPFFDTPYGVASLVLKEIPYSARAYITVQSALDLDKLLEECVSFCRMVGAEEIYAKGHDALQRYPVWMQLLQMQNDCPDFGDTSAFLEPVTAETLNRWTEIYNDKMRRVDNASYMTQRDAKEMLTRGDAYFTYKNGEPMGIVLASGGELNALASCVPGGGTEGLRALVKTFGWKAIRLEVASTNHKAIHLYKSLGFTEKSVISTWYKIL
jgi:hypothetical protein